MIISKSKRCLAVVLSAATAAGGASPVLADQSGGYGYGYGHPMWSGGWGGMFMGWGMMALFLIAVVVVIILLIKGLTGGDRPSASSALDILNERYARGEIDTAEYNERKKTISGNS